MRPLNPFDISFTGINLVEASAGTGKTYNITSLYIRALIELSLTVNQILVVTYTEAATKELKDRLLRRVRESVRALETNSADTDDQFLNALLGHVTNRQKAISKLEEAVRSFDEAAIYTIHGFCYQSLQEQAFKSRAMYGAEMIGDDSELVLEAVDDYWRNWVSEASQDSLKRPLLQFLVQKGYTPDQLASTLGPYVGQPHLQILPEDTLVKEDIYDRLSELRRIYSEMKRYWKTEGEQIRSMVRANQLDGRIYQKRNLDGWIQDLDSFLGLEDPPFELFDQYKKFRQTFLNDSLTKKSEKKGLEAPHHPFFVLADKYAEVAEFVRQYETVFKKELLLYVRQELQQKKEELQVLSFDDLLLQLRTALFDHKYGDSLAKSMRQKYPLALVDEFQDTDPNQYDIFRRIYKQNDESCALFMIGDPKQSIYSFRGADVFSYIRAKKDADENKVFGLGRNFRSTPGLIAGINELFGQHPNPFILEDIPFEGVKPGKKLDEYEYLTESGKRISPIRFRCLETHGDGIRNKADGQEKAAADSAYEIWRLIQGGKRNQIRIGSKPVQAKDIAVLVRSHYQAGLMSRALRERGVKSVQYSQESVFDSEEARQLEILLKAVAEPSNESLIKSALALPMINFSAIELLEVEENEQRWVGILDQFADWHKRWLNQGFSAMFRVMLKKAKISEHIIQYPDGERKLTNLLHLGELLQHEDQHRKGGTRGLIKWLARKRKEDRRQQDEEQLRLESDEELVKIVTMHRSKGLEYPIVFCPFLWHGPELKNNGQPLTFHDPNDFDITYLDLNGKEVDQRNRHRLLKAREELAESLRLAYVGITRAELCCYMSWTYANKTEFSPLACLFMGQERVFDLLEQTISGSYKAQGGTEVYKKIQLLCENKPEIFSMKKESPSGDQLDLLNGVGRSSFSCRSFERPTPLSPSYRISSFSSLTSWMDEDPDVPDYDQYLDIAYREESRQGDEMTIFTFPKGPQPGTCIHKIFEEINFSDLNDIEAVVEENLAKYGIGPNWTKVVSEMVRTIVDIPLLEADKTLKLSALTNPHFKSELEFYYQSEKIESKELLAIIRDQDESELQLNSGTQSGFLKGFIDLTFRYKDKFYLLDYKTNFLGAACNDYKPASLKMEMREASYDLQYHIYIIALHRFLKNRMPGYSYDQHFGGVFYLFLRGINWEGREGIFFDKPDFSTVRRLDKYISEGTYED